jgi:hypothetical protein
MGVAGMSRVIAMEGARNNVRSNCIAPIAWTRMTESGAVTEEVAAARRTVMNGKHRPDQPARFCVALVSAAAVRVSGQIFGVSGNDIILYSQPRPVETCSKEDGWSIEAILNEAVPKMTPKFYDLNRVQVAG